MGMYSHTDYCNLKIKEGKKEAFLKWLEEHEDWKEITEINENDEVYFDVDGWKIISYWYEGFLKELKELNEFLEGTWGLAYETPDQYAIIHFEPQGVEIESGVMKWNIYKLEDLIKEEEEIKGTIKVI